MSHKPIRTIESVSVPLEDLLIAAVLAGYCAFSVACAVYVLGGTLADMFGFHFEAVRFPGIAGLASLPLLLSWLWWTSRGTATYTIYEDHIDYACGDRLVSLAFDQVQNVKFSQWKWQRSRGIGTVVLEVDTRVARENGFLAANGEIAIHNIPEPGEIFELIRSLTQVSKP